MAHAAGTQVPPAAEWSADSEFEFAEMPAVAFRDEARPALLLRRAVTSK